MPLTKAQKKALKEQADFFGFNQCHTCKHSHHDGTCSAFPEGIPSRILADEVIHKKPYRGDHGIQYEEAEEVPDVQE